MQLLTVDSLLWILLIFPISYDCRNVFDVESNHSFSNNANQRIKFADEEPGKVEAGKILDRSTRSAIAAAEMLESNDWQSFISSAFAIGGDFSIFIKPFGLMFDTFFGKGQSAGGFNAKFLLLMEKLDELTSKLTDIQDQLSEAEQETQMVTYTRERADVLKLWFTYNRQIEDTESEQALEDFDEDCTKFRARHFLAFVNEDIKKSGLLYRAIIKGNSFKRALFWIKLVIGDTYRALSLHFSCYGQQHKDDNNFAGKLDKETVSYNKTYLRIAAAAIAIGQQIRRNYFEEGLKSVDKAMQNQNAHDLTELAVKEKRQSAFSKVVKDLKREELGVANFPRTQFKNQFAYYCNETFCKHYPTTNPANVEAGDLLYWVGSERGKEFIEALDAIKGNITSISKEKSKQVKDKMVEPVVDDKAIEDFPIKELLKSFRQELHSKGVGHDMAAVYLDFYKHVRQGVTDPNPYASYHFNSCVNGNPGNCYVFTIDVPLSETMGKIGDFMRKGNLEGNYSPRLTYFVA